MENYGDTDLHVLRSAPALAVGRKMILVRTGIPGIIAVITRINDTYWGVVLRPAKGAFNGRPLLGTSATVHKSADATTGRTWTAEYPNAEGNPVELTDSRRLETALAVAFTDARRRGVAFGLF